MRCSACGTENPGGRKFCGGCGAALTRACPSCGSPNAAQFSFCGECGSVLAEAGADGLPATGASSAASASSAGPLPGTVSERRVCSVLFADLVGFTPLSESKDPEEVREILSRYFDVARSTVIRYGGIVEKFIGDAVMAVWGAPVADEGDTERAVRAALDLVGAVGVLGAEVGAPGLAARAGVVTGEVAVTIGAQGEGMVAGDAVNTASRVQSVAGPGTVLVDAATRRLSESSILLEDAGSFALKGKDRPEQLFLAIRVLSGVGGKKRADGLEAPFTGRDVELRALKDLFHASVERRTPRLVVVSGPAGVGKSRLGWEFDKYIDGLADTVLWHRGRCLSYGEGVAFWALAEMVRQRFGIAEEDPTEVAESKLREGMVRYVADEAERAYVGVRLSRLLGVPYPSEAKVVFSQDELYAGWRLFLEHLAKVAPVAMLVEDAQYADQSLLGFFEHLVDWTRDLSIFVILFARPGLEPIDSGYGVGRNRTALSLDPLDDASMALLVGSLVPGMPPDACRVITDRAQGIPLFAVETVRSLIDQGVVERDGSAYRLVQDLGALSVPGSLHALLAARLDALPAEVRTLVADASVLGTTFPKEALVAVSGAGAEAVTQGLSELVKRDVLQVIADPLSPERGAYCFSQEMLRQVAYETLSKKDRKARHLAVAAHLRSAFPNDAEEIADAIARHYLDALSYGPSDPDVADVTKEALRQLIRAAERAERSGALLRAAESYLQATAVAPHDESAGLYERAADMYLNFGDYDASVRCSMQAIERFGTLGRSRAAARSRSKMEFALGRAGRGAEGRKEVAAALEVLQEGPDVDTVEALVNASVLHTLTRGDLAEAQRLTTEALALAQALGTGLGSQARLFIAKGHAAAWTNRVIEAESAYQTAVRLAERAGDLGVLALAQLNLADCLACDDPRGAAEAARSAATHARRTGTADLLAYALSNLSVALVELGEWDEALAVLSSFGEGGPLTHPALQRWAGVVAGLRGDADGAASAVLALSNVPVGDDIQALAGLGLLRALAAAAAGDEREALTRSAEVLTHRDQLAIRHECERWAWPVAARAARTLGDTDTTRQLLSMLDSYPVGHLPPILRALRKLEAALLAADGEPSATTSSAPAVLDAVGTLREVGNPYHLAHGLIDLAEVLARAGEDGGDAALAESRAIAEQLRCPPLLARAASAGSVYAR